MEKSSVIPKVCYLFDQYGIYRVLTDETIVKQKGFHYVEHNGFPCVVFKTKEKRIRIFRAFHVTPDFGIFVKET